MLSAVSLPVSFEPVERSIGIDTELPETDAAGAPAEWVAWGCHGFLRNTDAPSQTDARVAFRRLVILCAEYFTRLYGVSHYLRQVLLGYPWVSEGHPKNRLYGNPRIALEPDA